MNPLLSPTTWKTLGIEQRAFQDRFPGETEARQPVHVVYGGAHLFSAGTPAKLGALARQALETWAPDAPALSEALGISNEVAAKVHPRLVAKLAREPIEDFRIDFEDGYGQRSPGDERQHAQQAGAAWREAEGQGALPPFCGVRLKPLTLETGERALATLETFVTAAMPTRPMLVTLPKVETLAQVTALAEALDALEAKLHLQGGVLQLEAMIESSQSLTGVLPRLRQAAGARLFSVHFGAWDFMASLDLAASEQRLAHPACDFARLSMKLAFSGTPVFLSDGATIHLPVAPHRGASLTDHQHEENRRAVHAAWQSAARDIRHSLAQGYFQGWDLHPAQVVARYGTLFSFFLENLEPMRARLKSFEAAQERATLTGTTFDDAASIRGLQAFFTRARRCGAID